MITRQTIASCIRYTLPFPGDLRSERWAKHLSAIVAFPAFAYGAYLRGTTSSWKNGLPWIALGLVSFAVSTVCNYLRRISTIDDLVKRGTMQIPIGACLGKECTARNFSLVEFSNTLTTEIQNFLTLRFLGSTVNKDGGLTINPLAAEQAPLTYAGNAALQHAFQINNCTTLNCTIHSSSGLSSFFRDQYHPVKFSIVSQQA